MRRMYVASMLLFAYVSFFLLVLWLGICAEVDVDRITILPPPFLASLFIYFFFAPTHNSLFNTKNQCAPKAGFGAI